MEKFVLFFIPAHFQETNRNYRKLHKIITIIANELPLAEPSRYLRKKVNF